MSIMDKLKGLFHRQGVGEELRGVFDDAKNPRELLQRLDERQTINEVELKALGKQIERLAEQYEELEARIRAGGLEGRRKRNALLEAQRTKRQLAILENREVIYDRNVSLLQTLMARVQDMQAMDQRGVQEDQIDRVVVDFEQQFAQWQSTMLAGEVATREMARPAAEDASLAALEREILGPAKTAQPEADPELAKLEAEIMRPRPAERRPLAKDQDRARAQDLED